MRNIMASDNLWNLYLIIINKFDCYKQDWTVNKHIRGISTIVRYNPLHMIGIFCYCLYEI